MEMSKTKGDRLIRELTRAIRKQEAAQVHAGSETQSHLCKKGGSAPERRPGLCSCGQKAG